MLAEPATDLSPNLLVKRDALLATLRDMGSVAVAFSGGIDSTVVAEAAFYALGDKAVAVTADSPSVASADLDDARRLAKLIGIRHIVVPTEEFADPNYVRNDGSRCYFCKSELYTRVEKLASSLGIQWIVSGANLDDGGDYRPGLKAAAEHGIRHPLQESGCTKADVRALAKHWNLPTWDKPASPCLSSRLAPGLAVTPERTRRVEEAEAYLRNLGLREFRVRLHEGEVARIEVPLDAFPLLLDPSVRERLIVHMKSLGYLFVTLDLEGFRSGSLNSLVSLDLKQQYRNPVSERNRVSSETTP